MAFRAQASSLGMRCFCSMAEYAFCGAGGVAFAQECPSRKFGPSGPAGQGHVAASTFCACYMPGCAKCVGGDMPLTSIVAAG
eukprot:3494110-Lingulodinium_polyedra.AAC.1